MSDPFNTGNLLEPDFCDLDLERALLAATDTNRYSPETPCVNITIELMKEQGGENSQARFELENLLRNLAKMTAADKVKSLIVIARHFACADLIQQRIDSLRWCVDIEKNRPL